MATLTQRPSGARPVARHQDPFDQIFESMMPAFFRPVRMNELAAERLGTKPSIDILDRENEILVRAEVPGVKKEDLSIEVQGNQLFLSGRHEDESEQEQGNYLYRERRFGSFTRSIQLPEDVDGDKVKASCQDGILEITLPKAETAKRKKISVE